MGKRPESYEDLGASELKKRRDSLLAALAKHEASGAKDDPVIEEYRQRISEFSTALEVLRHNHRWKIGELRREAECIRRYLAERRGRPDSIDDRRARSRLEELEDQLGTLTRQRV